MQQFRSIQYLRAVAALLVVLHHARNPASWLYNPFVDWHAGAAGVDIFFVISGFIMYAAAREEPPLIFVRRRLTRILPLYWLATIIVVVLFAIRGRITPDTSHVVAILKSLSFIPHYSVIEPTKIYPVLVPGWTLNYEMFFYLLFAIGLATGRVVAFVVGALAILVLLGISFTSQNALWSTYTSPLLLEFVVGMLVARFRDTLIRPTVIALLPIGFVVLLCSDAFVGPRLLLWGLPSVAIVVGALAIEAAGRLPNLPAVKLLGDASYSIYLFQLLGNLPAAAIVKRLPLTGLPQFAAMAIGSVVGAIAVGLLFHWLFERPINRRLAQTRSAAHRHDGPIDAEPPLAQAGAAAT